MTFTARQVLTAAQLNDLSIDTLTTTGNVTVGGTLTATIAAAGSDGQIQYNNGGVFAGASNLSYNDTTNTITASGEVIIRADQNSALELQPDNSGRPYMAIYNYNASSVKTRVGYIGFPTATSDSALLSIRAENGASWRMSTDDSTATISIQNNGTTGPELRFDNDRVFIESRATIDVPLIVRSSDSLSSISFEDNTTSLYGVRVGAVGNDWVAYANGNESLRIRSTENYLELSSEAQGILFPNTEGSGYYTTAEGLVTFDQNFNDTAYGTDTYAPANVVTGGDGGGLLVYNQDGWGAVLTTQNTRWMTPTFDGLNVNGNVDLNGTGHTINVGRGDVYIEQNAGDNQSGAGITLRTSSNPATNPGAAIFAVRSSGQAARLWVGQDYTSTGYNDFYVGNDNNGDILSGQVFRVNASNGDVTTSGDVTASGNITASGEVQAGGVGFRALASTSTEGGELRLDGGSSSSSRYARIDRFGANYLRFLNESAEMMLLDLSNGNLTATGRVYADTLELTSGTDHLTFTQTGDDWTINNPQQNNGITIYDGTGGVEIKYAGSAVFEADSGGPKIRSSTEVYGRIRCGYSGGAVGGSDNWYEAPGVFVSSGDNGISIRSSNSNSSTTEIRPAAGTLYIRDYLDLNYHTVAAIISDQSSATLKQDIAAWGDPDAPVPITGSALDMVSALRPVSYRWRRSSLVNDLTSERRQEALFRLNRYRKDRGLEPFVSDELIHLCGRDCDGTTDDPCSRYAEWERGVVGLVAEEVFEVMPNAVQIDHRTGQVGGIKPTSIVAVCVKAIQELLARVEQLESAA